MAWQRLMPPLWFTQYLAGFSLLLVGSALLGSQAVEGNETAGAALVCVWGVVWAWLASIGQRRKKAQEA